MLRSDFELDDKRDPRTYAIIGAAMEVHSVLAHGFAEPVYQDALEMEFVLRGIPFQREFEVHVRYKDRVLKSKYRPDFICYESVIVELKALSEIGGIEDAQVINYLKATGYTIGLLINFGVPRLKYKRLIFSGYQQSLDDGDPSVS